MLALAVPGATRLLAQPAGVAEKIRRADELMKSGKPDEAIPIYRELTEAFPRVPSYGINLAFAQYHAGRYREAIEQCKALVKLRPDVFQAWLLLGASHLELSEAASAVEPLRKAVALQPEDRDARVMFAGALLLQERYAEAAPQFEEAARVAPDVQRVWYGLGRSYEALATESFQRLDRAVRARARFCLRADTPCRLGETAELLAFAGFFQLDRGELARAFELFRQALVVEPSLKGLHAAVAGIYETTGHPDWAAAERAKEPPTLADCRGQSLECDFAAGRLREIISASAQTPSALYWRSRALRELSRQAYARLDGLPASPEKYQAAAHRYEKDGLYREAAGAWTEALKLSPNDANIQRRLVLALCDSNDCASALPLLKRLLGREPSSAMLHYLYGRAVSNSLDAGQALPYLETAVKLDGKYLPARAALGQAYLEAGSPERAIPQLEAAVAKDEDGSRHYQLARAYQAAGKQEQAAAVLRKYREIVRRRQAEERNQPRITAP